MIFRRSAAILSFGFTVIALLSFAPADMVAQTADVGIQRFGAYDGNIDQINLGNLNVTLDIPLFMKKGRGVGTDINFNVSYNSNTIFETGVGNNSTNAGGYGSGGVYIFLNPNWGSVTSGTPWSGTLQILPHSTNCGNGGGVSSTYQYVFVSDDGQKHVFSGSTQATCGPNGPVAPYTSLTNVSALDGSGYLLNASGPSGTVTDVSGTQMLTPQAGFPTLTDANGNQETYADTPSTCGSPPCGFYAIQDSAATVTGGKFVTTSSTQQPTVISYPDTNGNTQTTTITYKTYQANPQCVTPPCVVSVSTIDRITYADQSYFAFSYETSGGYITGRISEITLPTGGTISYSYSGAVSLDFEASQMTRTTSDGATTYSVSASTGATGGSADNERSLQTTVSYPDGHSEVTSFIQTDGDQIGENWRYYVTAHTVYQAGVGSTVLLSSMECYNGATGNCTTTAITEPITQLSVTTSPTTALSSKVVTTYNSQGLPTEVDQYDYNATVATKVTKTVYASLGNNIQDRPQTVTISNGGGSVLAQSTYSYDEYSLATSSASGLTAITGSRGNPTSVQKMVSGSAVITTHAHYDTAGQMVCTVDGNHSTVTSCGTSTTNYGYDATDTYLISTTYPAVAAGTFSVSSTPDPNTGLVTQSKDMNSKITYYAYDSMLRQAGVCSPDGGYTQTLFPSFTTKTVGILSGSGTGCTSASAPSGTYATSTLEYDGYGRLIHSIDPVGNTVDTSYDSMGRVYSTSNAHTSAGESTDGTTYYFYDALSRKTKQTNQDTTSFQYWCYNGTATAGQPDCRSHLGSITGSWVDFQDEDTNQWQRTSDALGRLTQVVEPGSLVTTYAYDALNDLQQVNQLGNASNGDTPRARTFNYDSLSRLLCASNPENSSAACPTTNSGYVAQTIGYTYDANSNVQSKTDARGVVTGYGYDALNRLLSKTHTNAPAGTMASCYQYDTATNGSGKLGFEWTQSASCPNPLPTTPLTAGFQSQRVYGAYDAMGRALTEQQCVAGNCTSTSVPSQPAANCTALPSATGLQYCYDLAGNLLAYSNGITTQAAGLYPQHAILFAQGYDAAGRLNNVSSSWTDGTHPSPLFSLPAYTPFNSLSSWQLGNQLTTTRTYDNRLRVTGQSSAQ